MASSGPDNSQWLSVTEETLFLHDGLIRVTDLVELPQDVQAGNATATPDNGHEVVTFDSKSPAELCEKLLAVCGNQNNEYSLLLEYRLNALRGLWVAQRQQQGEDQADQDGLNHEETLALLKKQGIWQPGEQVSFSSRVSLLLIFPLLKSQSRSDPSLCCMTAELLLQCLRDCAPLSLTKEPSDCLNGLESLLCSWLEEGEGGATGPVQDVQQRENAAAALVALACARGSLKTLLHTVHLLQRLQTTLSPLPVAELLFKLLQTEGGPGLTTSLLGSKHLLCWGFEDMLTNIDKGPDDKDKDTEIGRNLACDGCFLYTTNSEGRGLSKIGSGLHGTLRGFLYARNPSLEQGWVVWGGGRLVHRPANFDGKQKILLNILSPHTLQCIASVPAPDEYVSGSAVTTLALTSDGVNFYWVWSPALVSDKNVRNPPVYMDTFRLQDEDGSVIAVAMATRVTLQRKEGDTSKSLNEALLSRLRPYTRSTSAASLIALTGGNTTPTGGAREETSTASSCGLSLKLLRRTPIYTCGSTLVMLTAPPGSSSSTAARSLFGSGTSLSSLRVLATSLCFSTASGQYTNRCELVDAPTCSLARGASVQGLGVCYDAVNNLIWTCSGDWVDQWHNPGNQAPHHVCRRLGIDTDIQDPPQDNLVACPEVINQLMRHVGFSCCHQLTSDLLNTVLGKILLQQPNIDTRHLGCVCDILDSAVSTQDRRLTLCVLIVLQVIFKSFIFKNESEEEAALVKKTRTLVWRLLTTSSCAKIQEEAANVCSAGQTVLYPEEEEQNKLLKLLLLEGEDKSGLGKLRDLILLDLADQLTHPPPASDKMAPPLSRLKDDLVQLILKLCVRESCVLLRTCVTADQQEFNTIVSSVPKASPCLRYIMALLSHVMSSIVTVSLDKHGSQEENRTNKLHEMIQGTVLGLATKVLLGCQEVLEELLDVCRSFSSGSGEDRECRFQGLERVAKATVLGHLLPVLMTSLTHGNLKYLPLADALMPQLVQLVVLSSQCALLLKPQACRPGAEEPPPTPTSDVVELIGGGKTEETKHDSEDDAGFLFGVKIPAPWATGKSVESIHPVRDNYKFRETVQIPGARCLYLRFDPRCSSQYDYDKLMTFAGPSTSCRKVAEYGGNTLGYGSRSVLGSGWPKDLVKVDGDTVTFSFEMRSGREHNTPDRAMWGFLITVRAQEASEDVSGGLPFLTDLALGLSVLACNMLHILYRGPEVTQEEQACRHLLKSRLLQRCVWKVECGTVISPVTPPPHLEGSELTLTRGSGTDTEKEPSSSDEGTPMDEDVSVMGAVLPRIKLSPAIMHKLRKLSGRAALQFRPSIREVLEPDVLEETVVSVVIKHLGLFEILQQLSVSEEGTQTADFQLLCDIMGEAFKKLNALERQLQALAEMEQKWQNDVEEAGQGQLHDNTPFFLNFHLQETTRKDLALLCYLKEVELNPVDLEGTIKMLKELFDKDVSMAMKERPFLLKTRLLLEKLLARAELLLHVTIETEESGPGLARSMSQHPSSMPPGGDVPLVSPHLARSISAPSTFDAESGGLSQGRADLGSTGRWKRQRGQAVFLQELVEDRGKPDKPAHAVLLDQLFSFIGSSLEENVSCSSFLSAASVRWQRGNSRKQALVHMVELLTAAARVGGATHLVSAVTSVLQHGPKVEELTCGGMVNQVREAFAETMTSVVQLASTYPIACSNSIGLLCVIPYTRAEERCLVRSGLVQLLDKLCSLSSYRDQSNTETQTIKQRVSAMAWAGFQVLSNRCVMWEDEEGAASAVEHSGLARQVSALLTNHLARATECSGDEAAGTEALQEVLSLLNNLSRSKLGKAILSQPACVSKLLSLLLDQRPSPKLVLIVLQLCRVALPLISAEDCEKIQLPSWGQDMHVFDGGIQDPAARIASLLLAKLGDYVVPGAQTALSLASPDHSQPSAPSSAAVHGGTGDRERLEETEAQDGRIAVYVHKREDQSSHEVIQPLLSCDGRPFRLGSGANMEKVVRMDRDLTRSGRAEVITEDAVTAIRRAAKWAQAGLVVSTGPPADGTGQEGGSTDRKRMASSAVCREKNAELARADPVRPFISGQVANSMAGEVIGLLHGLLTAPESSTAQIWASAVERVLTHALLCLPTLLTQSDVVLSPSSSGPAIADFLTTARQVVAALCALGGFREGVKPGTMVQITGEGMQAVPAQVVSISEQQGVATVRFENADKMAISSDTLQVPLTRVQPPKAEALPLDQLSMTEKVIEAQKALLVPQPGQCVPAIQAPLPAGTDGSSALMAAVRVMAEIRTRSCMVLATHLGDRSFAARFVENSASVLNILRIMADEFTAGERLPAVEAQCERLRMLYRDCARPPPPPSEGPGRQPKEITWCTSRVFPPPRSCLFSHGLSGVAFLGDPSAGSGLPRGTFLYASAPVPSQAPSFYWEIEVCSFGETDDESGPIISFGFAPTAEKRDGAWTNPVGTVLFHNNGRAVHYNGSSLLQWKSARLDVTLSAGDVAGIGWERVGEAPSVQGEQVKGRVYFTYNGQRLPAVLDDVSGGMWPVIHIQKKNTRIRANFGSRPFAFAEGQHHRNAADMSADTTEEISATFGLLPFHLGEDSDSETAAAGASGEEETPPQGPPVRIAMAPEAQPQYNSSLAVQYRLQLSYDNFLTSGPDMRAPLLVQQEDESDDEDAEEDLQQEDHYALLVKAWEQKVFPTIRRRFRNEAERKSGLEQIKGALQLGMVDIARQTVEFLYEENGGMPRDLHLPTIEDIRAEAMKFTIERVRKGMTVVIRHPQTAGVLTTGSTVLPKFAVRGMLKTFGSTGVVLDVDSHNELVQVETYLRSEGVLVRYWYPIDMLERPPQGTRKASITGVANMDTSNIQIHRQLLQCESSLVHYYCRTALLSLLSHCRPHILDRCPVPSMVETFSSLSRDIDPDYMQLLSNQLLSCPAPNGSVVTLSLEDAVSPQRCLVTHGCAASTVFHSRDHPLREELRNAIVMAACHGEDTLIDLSDQLCACLQTAPELFAYEEFPVTETKVNTDAYFPGAAFLIVSCRTDPDVPRKDTALYKSPWARLFCYGIGHQLRKNGHVALQEVTCYPRDAAIAGTGGLTPPPLADQYPPAVLPCDRVHVRVGVSPPPGYVVTIHAVPPEFALAISFIEELISVKHQVDSKDVRMEEQAASSYDIPAGAFVHLVELLGGYVWKSDVPAALKEVMFHLLAELLRASQPRKEDGDVCLLTLSPSLALLTHVSLQAELRKLYDHENKRRTRSDVIGSGEYSRFSSYFHALMEVALAVAEVTSPVGTTVPVTTATAVTSATPAPSGAPYPYPSASPPSPMLGAKRKKIRARRERDRGAMGGKHKPQLHPESEGGVSMGSKPEEMLWFHRAVTMSLILRYLAFRDPQGEVVTNDAVADACQTMTVPTAHSRLLVLSGIPMHLEQGAVRDAIRKACNMYGGLFRDEVFVPLQEKEDLPVPPGEVLSPSAAPVEQTAEGQAAEPADVGEVEAGLEEAASVGGQVAMGDEASTAADLETQQLLASTLDSAPLPAPLASPEQDSPSADLPPDGLPPSPLAPPCIKGYAVVEIRSKSKMDDVRSALLSSKAIVGVVTYDTEELIDVTTDDMLSVSPVNLNLLSDPQGSPALGDYLRHKILSKSSASGLTQKAQDVLTEIFHSCVVSEHAFSLESPELEQHELVHLGKDQISLQTPMNHLHAFFSNIKGPKKSFMEQVSQVLRRYGVPKPKLKESEKPWKGPKLGNGKPSGKKLAQKPSKEKLALAEVTGAKAVVQKPSPGEKKGKSKPQEKPGKPGKDQTEDGAKRETPEDKYLTLEGFLLFVADKTKQDARSVWKAILACGYDLHFDRCACVDTAHAVQTSKQWTLQMDCALVEYVDSLCRHLAISAARLHPHELYLREAELASPAFACLQGVPVESLRLRFALLLSLNNTLETFFLPLVDLRPCRTYPNSTAALLSRARRLMFYDTKVVVMNSILNATAQRNPSQAAPEITLDPLEIVGGEAVTAMGTQFCQAARQLSIVPSSQLCVKLASGGDPTYAFNVRFTGEEVHGTSGSFRHFLWQVCKELQGPILNLLMLCPSATANRNKGKYILRPGPLTYGEEKLLEFLGQLLGVAVRADVPLPLDLLTPFWKGLVGLPLDEDDLREADILTFNYITRLAEAETESDFWAVCAEVCPAQLQEGEGGEHPLCSFTFSSVTGEDVELCAGGRNRMLSWENRVEYLSCIRALRLDELRCSNRMAPVLAGLATIVPVQILHILSPADLELRTCGMPHVDLAFLRSHTMYQVGLMETDTHIEFFWSSLESFSQDQLRKFVKFACNQERIPCTCPCKDGGPDTAHVPPYPMKIAPPDGPGSPDSRYIRVETCMFMIKLPQYSSQETMTERLLYAINCREDPLSG
ncbi:putative E3 ubiquitin-protein ligase HECTD4 [Branchiostoma floridae x Branchiostoma belcheri]